MVLVGAAKIEGQIDAQTLKPQKSYGDIVAFDLPAEGVLYLQLKLPASYMEVKNKKMEGAFKFKIPKSMLLGKGPLPDKEPKKEPIKDLPNYIAVRKQTMTNTKAPLPMRIAAVKELGELGSDGGGAATDLAIILTNKLQPEHLRLAAAEALGAIGPGAKDQVASLISAVSNDEFHLVRIAAAKSLGQMGALAENAIPALKKQLENKEPEVAAAARRAILKINPKEQLPPPPKM
jgi:hypothetical protein